MQTTFQTLTAGPAGSASNRATSPALAAQRLFQVSVTFVLVYAAANYLTSLRSDIGLGVFEWERGIPFIEWTVVPYLSIFALLPLSFFVCRDAIELQLHARRLLLALALAVACYAAFPLGFHFVRPQPQGPFASLFALLWAVDLPYNRAPSLHIVVLLLIWPRLVACIAAPWQRAAMHGWLAAIGVSVLTTYQHHMIDIAGGAAVAGACFALTSRAEWLPVLRNAHELSRLLRGMFIGLHLRRPTPAEAPSSAFAPSRFAC